MAFVGRVQKLRSHFTATDLSCSEVRCLHMQPGPLSVSRTHLINKEVAMEYQSRVFCLAWFGLALLVVTAQSQLIDNTQAPNTAKAGINKSLLDETGAGRGNVMTEWSSAYIIARDPFRSIRRGRQLFQRKFT